MVGIMGGANDAFQSGINHVVLNAHENTNSIVLDGALQRDSDTWAALTPHAVLNTAMGGSQDDSSWEQVQREQGGYQPGSMTSMADHLDQGTSDNAA